MDMNNAGNIYIIAPKNRYKKILLPFIFVSLFITICSNDIPYMFFYLILNFCLHLPPSISANLFLTLAASIETMLLSVTACVHCACFHKLGALQIENMIIRIIIFYYCNSGRVGQTHGCLPKSRWYEKPSAQPCMVNDNSFY